MIKPVFYLGVLFTLCSSYAWADFDYPGEGKVSYPTGVEKPFKFGFGWQKNNEQFTIGTKSYNMQLPESYSIAITLSKDEQQIWVQEFNNGFIEGFNWKIGEHTLALEKRQFKDPVKGNYVISLDNKNYFFARNNISIMIKFSEEGIETIAIDGVTKDMGTKQ
ncbi:hypothetical protein AMS58_11175 [Pseudoalteromonas porphyrae]|uniref:Secreted protein n=2 Tax=Pseudoalteromonas TaxID=53246 RepID=A0A0N1EP21_9GAMM|nr:MULTISPECIES: hypothetical protein [Pseudoalteromonas]KPH64697.1 hypothetical protein ADS77_05385 [Pseudoalteromonas porphyrae]KPH94555.1 hypothetical protein AMS58_11175 [Pseudoalteromonas porphyrae]NMR26953.1 hypothetical protein [Pseudoalteromonas sp. NEC-BIFX-2020_015]NNG43905.1 hypothetical protein [Pseudoalteromonas sp. NEC-BIFX-2020_002]